MLDFSAFQHSPAFNKDNYDLGHTVEIELLPVLQSFFNDPMIQLCPEGYTFDYAGIDKLIELKSRSYTKDHFSDTMIGVNKIESARHHYITKNSNVYFVFKFLDGTYYWKYDPATILRKHPAVYGVHYFIPVEELCLIDISGSIL